MASETTVTPTRITLAIGFTTITYELWTTGAPIGADYNDVIQIYDDGTIRYVLIPIERVAYQTGRYHSFMMGHTEPSDMYNVTELTKRMYATMMKRFKK